MARGECRSLIHDAVEKIFNTADKVFEEADKLLDQVFNQDPDRRKIRVQIPLKALEKLGRGRPLVFKTDAEDIVITLKA